MPLAPRCASEFDNRVRSRGHDYARSDAVEIVLVDDTCAEALVYGSGLDPYEVWIDWNEEQDRVLHAGCSCPHFAEGHLCKHIWATMCKLDEQLLDDSFSGPPLAVERLDIDEGGYVTPRLFEPDTDADDSHRHGLDDDLDRGFSIRTSRAAPQRDLKHSSNGNRDRHGSRSRAAQPDWIALLRELQHRASVNRRQTRRTTSNKRPAVARYVIDASQTIATGELTIDLFYQERKKNGDFGKLKRLKFTEDMVDVFEEPSDRELLPQLLACGDVANGVFGHSFYSNYYASRRSISSIQLPASMHSVILPRLVATGRFFWMLHTTLPPHEAKPITAYHTTPLSFRLTIDADNNRQAWTLGGELYGPDVTISAEQAIGILSSGLLLAPESVYHLEPSSALEWIQWIGKTTSLTIPYADRDTFLKLLWSTPNLPPIRWPDNLAVEQTVEQPRACARIRRQQNSFYDRNRLPVDVVFLYGDNEVVPDDPISGFTEQTSEDAPVTKVRIRDRENEQQRLDELFATGAVRYDNSNRADRQLYVRKRSVPVLVEQLLAKGWQVEAENKPYRSAGDFHVEVQSGIDWFDMDASIDFEGIAASLPDLLNAVRKGERFIELGDGSHGILPDEWLERYSSLVELGETTDGKVRFKKSQALLLDALLAEQQNLRVDQAFKRFRNRLHNFAGVTPKDAPRTFQGTLRPYQREGLGWFKFLNDMQLGGCLADDMGLGKTIQVLALLESRRTSRRRKGEQRLPSLIVVPKSLIFNWIDEAGRFTPRLRVLNYTGVGRKQLDDQLDDAHVILTTYGTLRRDILELKDRHFDFVILDEAQAIKNASSQAAKACLLLQSKHRLALTGTPIENHLGELWSLFEFLNPGMLGHSRAFTRVCKNVRDDDGTALRDLSRAIAPFVLRRTKEQVLSELPQKTEQTVFCELAPKERKAYNELREFYRAKLSKVIDKKGLRQSKIHVLEALLRLRQAACHPGLIDPRQANKSSTKLDTLLEQLEEVIGEGHKALVFSQFTSLLAIVRHHLEKHSIGYEYLDGKTRNRKEIVDRFQQPSGHNVFLISLKAGGQGLNLTEADYVFILDPWWNPAVEIQAIDRAHRIGQTRPVFAYRIIARDTVEEKVLELQDSKRELANAIITANDSLIRQLTADDLQRILS